METVTLKPLIEKRQTVRFWGEKCLIKPLLVNKTLGDGKKLLWLEPMMTRPNYYVIRVDSKWDSEKDLEATIEAIVDEYSEREREREYLIEDGVSPERADLAYYEKELGWPVFCDEGCSWGDLDWPKQKSKAA